VTRAVAPADLARWIHEIGRGRTARALSQADARALGEAMFAGAIAPLELGAILIAYRVKGESLPELIAFMSALAPHVARLGAPRDDVRPVVLPAYNGARRLPNLTALVALLLRREGVPVLLHGVDGNHVSGRVGTEAVLAALDIPAAASIDDAQRRLAQDGIAYVPIALLAPPLAALLALRERMGVRNVAHTLAKLIDPFEGRGIRVVAVTHPDYLTRMHEFLAASAADALLMQGTEGEPFAHPRRAPRLEAFARGVPRACVDEAPAPPAEIPSTIDAEATAVWIRRVLAADVPVPRPIEHQALCCARAARQP
jgi:anthranilate phosphoribosyltransferase